MKTLGVALTMALSVSWAVGFADTILSDWQVPDDRDGWIHNHSNDGYTGLGPKGDSGSWVRWAVDGENGYLKMYDVAAGAGDFAVAAPKFLGDWSRFFDAGIAFDYRRLDHADGTGLPYVRIYSGSAYRQWTPAAPIKDTQWHSLTVPLVESAWSTSSMSWDQMISNVTEILVYYDLRSGKENNALDNFALNWTPTVSATAPEGLFLPGWVWFSIPLHPAVGYTDASTVLGFDCTNRVYGWDDAAKVLALYPDDFRSVQVGPSYLARLNIGEEYAPTYWGLEPTRPFEWTLPAAGWCWVGVPGTQDVYGLDLRVTKDDVERTPAEDKAAADPWLNWNWIFWCSDVQTPGILDPFGAGDDETLHPWWGYRVWSNTENVTIIFP